MKKNCLALLFISFHILSFANEIDSLKILANKEGVLEKKAVYYTRLCSLYCELSTDTAKYYGQLAVDILSKKNNHKFLAEAYNYYALALEYSGDYKKSLPLYHKAVETAKRNKQVIQIGKAYFGIGLIYKYQGVYDTSLMYNDSAINIYDPKNHKKQISDCYNAVGMIHRQRGEFQKQLQSYKEAIEYVDTTEYSGLAANALSNLGQAYLNLELFDKAALYFLKSIRINEALNLDYRAAIGYNNLAIVNSKINNHDKASEYFWKSYNIHKKHNRLPEMISSKYNIAMIHERKENNDTALKLHLETYELAKQLGNKYYNAVFAKSIGILYVKLKKYDLAKTYLNESYQFNLTQGDLKGQAQCLYYFGRIDFEKRQFEKAEELMLKAFQISKKNNYSSEMIKISEILTELYIKKREPAKALIFFETTISFKDTIFNIEKANQINKLEIAYETEKKEQQIEFLDSENSLKAEKIRFQYKANLVFAGALFLSLVFLGLIYYQFKAKNKAYLKLVEKNKELTDSEKRKTRSKAKITQVDGNDAEDLHIDLINRLNELIEKDAPHLKNDTSLRSIAKMLGTNTSYLSAAINKVYKKNFNSYFNQLRVKEAMKKILDQEYTNYSIEGIASLCGFNNKTTFNTAFKNFTGITPTYYRKNASELKEVST